MTPDFTQSLVKSTPYTIRTKQDISYLAELVAELYDNGKKNWSKETLAGIQSYLCNYITATWKEYYNPTVYQDAGIANPYEVFEQAWNSEHSRKNRKEISAKVIKYFQDYGIINEEPAI